MGHDSPVYPRRLGHSVPPWVEAGATFHIRIRAEPSSAALIEPRIASALLDSVRFYHERERWHCSLFLIMPDHLHALLSFGFEDAMTRTVGDWKRYTAKAYNIQWQTNFFDHRLRGPAALGEKYAYIMRNPVAKGLCEHEDAWPWRWAG